MVARQTAESNCVQSRNASQGGNCTPMRCQGVHFEKLHHAAADLRRTRQPQVLLLLRAMERKGYPHHAPH